MPPKKSLTNIPTELLAQLMLPHLSDANVARFSMAYRHNNPAAGAMAARSSQADEALLKLANALVEMRRVRGMRGVPHFAGYLQTQGLGVKYELDESQYGGANEYERFATIEIASGRFRSWTTIQFYREDATVRVNDIPASIDLHLILKDGEPLGTHIEWPSVDYPEPHFKIPHILVNFQSSLPIISSSKFPIRWTKIVEAAFGMRRSVRTPRHTKR